MIPHSDIKDESYMLLLQEGWKQHEVLMEKSEIPQNIYTAKGRLEEGKGLGHE